jgi:hypothetical protein
MDNTDATYEWRPGTYQVGVRVEWEGVQLVCCMVHTTRYGAQHPWQVGGMKLQAQSCLWAPSGEVEAGKLKVLVVDRREEFPERLRALCLMAAGEAKAA